MSSSISDILSSIFEGKSIDLTGQNAKNLIEENVQQYEEVTNKLSDHYFEEWAENLLHLTNVNLFDTSVHYFSIFTKVIDVIPSFFPSDSQIFLLIVQSFLNHVIKNDELMKNFRLSFCLKIQLLICSNSTIDYSPIDLVLTICKSLHITEALYEEIYQYPFNFTENVNIDPAKQVFEYSKLVFTRYLEAEQLFFNIFKNSTDQTKSIQFINDILHTVFNQLITAKIHPLTFGVNPPLGQLLTTPIIRWIVDEYKTQKNIPKRDTNSSTNYKFDLSQLYEACSSYIYDEILKFTRGKNDNVGQIFYLIENLYFHYTRAFESVPGAMNFLESSIREALNDPRMKFGYNLAFYIDSLAEESIKDGSSFWMKLIEFPNENGSENCGCGCENVIKKGEYLSRSALLRAVMRIENKSSFCSYLADSINSLAAANGPEAMEKVMAPILDLVQLATSGMSFERSGQEDANHHDHHHHNHQDGQCCHGHNQYHDDHDSNGDHNNEKDSNNNENNNNEVNNDKVNQNNEHNNDEKSCCCHSHCGCGTPHIDGAHLYVEANLQFGDKPAQVSCDYLTFQILNVISEKGSATLEDLQHSIDGKDEDIENRVITLSDYLIIQNEDGSYSFDTSFTPETELFRIPPFFEEMCGSIETERHELVKQKILQAIETKGFEKLDFFITDSFVMLNRKVRPDTAMILDTLDEFVEDGKVTFENDVVTYVKEKKEEEEEVKEGENEEKNENE